VVLTVWSDGRPPLRGRESLPFNKQRAVLTSTTSTPGLPSCEWGVIQLLRQSPDGLGRRCGGVSRLDDWLEGSLGSQVGSTRQRRPWRRRR